LLQLIDEQTEETDDKEKDYDANDEGWLLFPVLSSIVATPKRVQCRGF